MTFEDQLALQIGQLVLQQYKLNQIIEQLQTKVAELEKQSKRPNKTASGE